MGDLSAVLRSCVVITFVVCVCHSARATRNVNADDAIDHRSRRMAAVHLRSTIEVSQQSALVSCS